MRVSSLADLPTEPVRLVVINAGTELVTTLALASAAQQAAMPVLLVNCDPGAVSAEHFDSLAERLPFDVLDAPLHPHGNTLDWLFRAIRAELVLLLDSDAELRDAEFVQALHAAFEVENVFGAGFTHGPVWLPKELGAAPETGLFSERPWMPCVMFRTAHVRAALDAGASFKTRVIYNDFAWSPRLSKLAATRFQTRWVPRRHALDRLPASMRQSLRHARFPWLRWARRDFFGYRPNYVFCDTGAALYQWCRYGQGLVFAASDRSLRRGQVWHYGGMTRGRIPGQTWSVANPHDVEPEIRGRLLDLYAIDWASLPAGSERPV